jgi:hypothetical protein
VSFDLAASQELSLERVESSTTETAASSPTTRTDPTNPPTLFLRGKPN